MTGSHDLLLEISDRYRRAVERGILRRDPHKPWMRRRELLVIEELLQRLAPRRCLEWGAGRSTLYLPTLLPAGACWTAIEHNEEWARRVSGRLRNPNVEVRWVSAPAVKRVKAGGEAPFRAYVDAPGGRYDFILVDGRARAACVRRAFDLLDDDGVVVLHDANRERYHRAFAGFPSQVSFLDWRVKYGGLWLGAKRRDLGTVIDVERYRRLWRLAHMVGWLTGL
jgi:predicted O-methyltransferase YrrM